jgi:cobalt-zinc-cadmium efflux system outer membrane protein
MMDRFHVSRTAALLLGVGIATSLVQGLAQELPPPRQNPPAAVGPAAVPVHASAVSPPPLTIYDAVRISVERHPVLRQATFNIQAAQGRADQAGRYPNPTVSIIGDEMSDRQGPGGIITAPQISQEIVLGGKLGLSQAAAQAELSQTSLFLQSQRFRLATEVRQAYFDVLLAQQRVAVLGQVARLAQQSNENAQALFNKGRIAELEKLSFQTELDRIVADLEAAQRERIAVGHRLAAVMGIPSLLIPSVVGNLESSLPQYDLDQLRPQVLEIHPDVQAARIGIARAEAALQRAEAEVIPNVTASAGYVRQNQNRSDDWMFQFSVPVPLYNRNQGNILAAHAEVGRAVQEVERVQADLAAKLAAAWGQYAAAKQRAERYKTAIRANADRAFTIAQDAYKSGVFEYLRVVQAQRTVAEANLEYIRALGEAWRAASEIAGLTLEEQWP